jgi:hypothetical protein
METTQSYNDKVYKYAYVIEEIWYRLSRNIADLFPAQSALAQKK